MKKIALLISMALVMGTVACGGDKPAVDPSSTSTTAAPTDPSTAAPAAPTDPSTAAPAAPATPAAPTK